MTDPDSLGASVLSPVAVVHLVQGACMLVVSFRLFKRRVNEFINLPGQVTPTRSIFHISNHGLAAFILCRSMMRLEAEHTRANLPLCPPPSALSASVVCRPKAERALTWERWCMAAFCVWFVSFDMRHINFSLSPAWQLVKGLALFSFL